MTNESEFNRWLVDRKSAIDLACSRSLNFVFKEQRLSADQIKRADDECERLHEDIGGDCDYETRGVGAMYIGRWHGKRVHDALTVVTRYDAALRDRDLVIVDIGCGTGAVLWAYALLACYEQESGARSQPRRILLCDSSDEMLKAAEQLYQSLKQFMHKFPLQDMIKCKIERHDWREINILNAGIKCCLTGSYLFSRTDATYSADIADTVRQMLSRNKQIEAAILWGSVGKQRVLHEIEKALPDWAPIAAANEYVCELSGQMKDTLKRAQSEYRKALGADLDLGGKRIQDWCKKYNWGAAEFVPEVCALEHRNLASL